MTRRDVAAMRLAYECLRDNAHGPNQAWRDGAATRVLHDAVRAARYAIPSLLDAYEGLRDFTGYRLLRARFALYLRARLRAEALERYDAWADDAPHESPRWRSPVCAGCAEHLPGYEVGDTTDAPCPKTGKREVARQCRPLWEQAAQWWATHERPGGGR